MSQRTAAVKRGQVTIRRRATSSSQARKQTFVAIQRSNIDRYQRHTTQSRRLPNHLAQEQNAAEARQQAIDYLVSSGRFNATAADDVVERIAMLACFIFAVPIFAEAVCRASEPQNGRANATEARRRCHGYPL
jgi:hypothetical protein